MTDKQAALAVLQNAVERCREEDIRAPEVFAALEFLEAQSLVTWPFDQFREAVLVHPGSEDWVAEGRWQLLNAAMNGIKRAVSDSGKSK